MPQILTICAAFIEKHGIVDGIYRHTGLQSNIQKLRNAFDEEKFAEIENEIYINDVHAVSSLLKMYFRELPNPLLTYQLYHKFIVSFVIVHKNTYNFTVIFQFVFACELLHRYCHTHSRMIFLARNFHLFVFCFVISLFNTRSHIYIC